MTAFTLDALAALFTAGFEAYVMPVQMSAEGLARMAANSDLRFDLSQVLLADGEPAGLGGIDMRGTQTRLAFFGIVKRWRRHGLGRHLCARLQAVAQEAGAREMVLEVIQSNSAAHALYAEAGFVDERELIFWEQEEREPSPLPPGVERLSPAAILPLTEQLPAVPRAWQNETCSLAHQIGGLSGLLLRDGEGAPVGYALFRDGPGRRWVLDLTAPPEGLATLIAGVAAGGRPFGLFNFPSDDPLTPLMTDLGFTRGIAQWEMRWQVPEAPTAP